MDRRTCATAGSSARRPVLVAPSRPRAGHARSQLRSLPYASSPPPTADPRTNLEPASTRRKRGARVLNDGMPVQRQLALTNAGSAHLFRCDHEPDGRCKCSLERPEPVRVERIRVCPKRGQAEVSRVSGDQRRGRRRDFAALGGHIDGRRRRRSSVVDHALRPPPRSAGRTCTGPRMDVNTKGFLHCRAATRARRSSRGRTSSAGASSMTTG